MCGEPGDRPHMILMSFLFENSSMPNRPSSRPMPEFLTPPNGRSGALLIVVFSPTISVTRFAQVVWWFPGPSSSLHS